MSLCNHPCYVFMSLWRLVTACKASGVQLSNSPGLVDFATGVVNCVLNLPNRQVKFFGEFTVINPGH